MFRRICAVFVFVVMLVSLSVVPLAVADGPVGSGLLPDYVLELSGSSIYGHRPLTVTAKISNTTEQELAFDVVIWVGGPAWGEENYPYSYSPNTEVYWLGSESGNDGIAFSWSGGVLPKETVAFTLPTFTGASVGENVLATISVSQSVVATATIVLTDGTSSLPLGGDISVGKNWYQSEVWLPGEVRPIVLTTWSQDIGQFIGGEMTSDCGLEGLPGGFYGHYMRTYETHLWAAYLPLGTLPQNCTLSIWVYQWLKPEHALITETIRVGEAKIYLPIVFGN